MVEVVTQERLPLLVQGVVTEVDQTRVVVEQREDPMHFKPRTVSNPGQKVGSLHIHAYWD